MVERRRAWHAIIALGRQTWSNDVRRGMPSLLLDNTHDLQRRVWHDIAAFGQYTRSNNVRRGMPSSPLESTHGRTTSGVACRHHLWAAQTVERRRTWYDMIALGLHARSNNVGRGIISPRLDSTHGRTTSGMACHHRLWAAQTVERRWAWHAIIALGRQTRSNNVRRDMPSPPLDSTHSRTTSGMACHHCLWAAQTVERRRACMHTSGLHTTLGQHTQSATSGMA